MLDKKKRIVKSQPNGEITMKSITPENIHYQAHGRFLYEMRVDGMGNVGVTKKILDANGDLYGFRFEPYRRFQLYPCQAKKMEDLKEKIASQFQTSDTALPAA